ncbi:hypothetical protein D3C80_225410 [compost metagenome]
MNDDIDRMTRTLIAALAEVERAAPGLSLSQLVMFLHILRREGVRMTALTPLCGRNAAVVSRGVRAMAQRGEAGTLEPAHGLVELLRGVDARSRHLAPTSAGLALAEQLSRLFSEEEWEGLAKSGAPAGAGAACADGQD